MGGDGDVRREALAGSRRLGRLVGPVLMALIASEFPLVQPDLYAEQIPPVVYLSGTLLLCAGLAVVRDHNRWSLGWPVLLTILGWAAMALGLGRMFFATRYSASASGVPTFAFIALETVLFTLGAVVTWNSYRRSPT